MGADVRFDYTAIGDTVNLAARLEGQTKFYGTNIIISETTKNELDTAMDTNHKDPFKIRELDLIRVKGKNEPISIYQIIVPNEKLDNNDILGKYQDALSLYRNLEFNESLELFKAIVEKVPDDIPSRLYIERCSYYINNPPPPDWDYVYIAESK